MSRKLFLAPVNLNSPEKKTSILSVDCLIYGLFRNVSFAYWWILSTPNECMHMLVGARQYLLNYKYMHVDGFSSIPIIFPLALACPKETAI